MVKIMTAQERDARWGVWFILPSVLVVSLLILYPILYNVYLSFFQVNLNGSNTFTGLTNIKNVLGNSEFWQAVGTSATYVVFSTVGTTVWGICVALAMNRPFPMRGLVRSLILLPYVAPVISVVFSWQFLFDPVNGIFMDVFYQKLHIFSERVNLINDPKNSLWVAILFSIWKNFPFTYLMVLSRLQAIDRTLYEAAEIDGCTGFQKFFSITLPEIFYLVGAIVLLRFIWNFNKFEEIYLLTPSVKVIPVYSYIKVFTGIPEIGQGAAIAIVQFVLILAIILVYVKKVLKW
ncbi:sugar ABC transporter permease [Candidatus Haliotispira prima]|uniref:Sugar ABC transporter permease n=1 Tax=Candidatus Haliotispira prima TaxID=3034016 RepID=A0ABY8MEU9_9SPIO|nr:sugar ABC transporter permease [Candidatus Haliotispira prima]